MSDVKRFACANTGYPYEVEDGEFVHFEDYNSILYRLDEAQKIAINKDSDLDALQSLLADEIARRDQQINALSLRLYEVRKRSLDEHSCCVLCHAEVFMDETHSETCPLFDRVVETEASNG